jgi:predicted secreted protein
MARRPRGALSTLQPRRNTCPLHAHGDSGWGVRMRPARGGEMAGGNRVNGRSSGTVNAGYKVMNPDYSRKEDPSIAGGKVTRGRA